MPTLTVGSVYDRLQLVKVGVTAALLVAEPMLLTFRMDVYSSTADALKVLFKVGRRLG